MTVRIAKAGRCIVAVATALLVGGAAAALVGWDGAWPAWLVAAPLLVLWLWVLYFFRDPDRIIPDAPGQLVSPADGVVTDITPVGADSELGCEGVRVGVFMSVFNVHVNRIPCDGRITRVVHRGGTLRDVRRQDAWELNEATTITMSCDFDSLTRPIVVRQIAGLVARRIVCDLTEGQHVARGERLGMIRFGSRLELIWPTDLHARVAVTVGQKVFGGSSVLARVAGSPGERTDDG